MCPAAGVTNGSVILDPMCGRGTTLLEGAIDWPDAHYIGGDLDDTTLEYARTNAERAIKPNTEKVPNKFQGTLSLQQLRYAGVFEAVKICRWPNPYATRTSSSCTGTRS